MSSRFTSFLADRVAEIVAPMLKEERECTAYYKRLADTWRGIAAEMGYEPKSHLSARPKNQWLLDRCAQYRREAAEQYLKDKS